MLAGAFALMERSLRLDARTRSAHLLRLGLIGTIYLAFCQATLSAFVFGAPGLVFFRGIAYLDALFITLLGIGFFSSVITEEKEEDTLGLMLMAGISPLGILTGKSVGGLWQAMLMIAVQYPVGLLAVTLGGVTRGQVWALTVALLAYIVFLAGFGLFCSTISSHNRKASWRTAAGVFLYSVLPGVAWMMFSQHQGWLISGGTAVHGPESVTLPNFAWTLLEGISGICIFLQIGTILSTGAEESTLTIQVVSNVAMGVLFSGLAWLFFGISTRRLSSEPVTRGLIAHRKGFLRFSAGRAWTNPFLWKDFHFVSGGVVMTIVRTIYYILLGLMPWLAEVLTPGPRDGNIISGWIAVSICLILFSATVSAARVFARSMQDEIRGQTLPSLMMLPTSTARIVYSKYAGAVLGCLPGPVIAPLMLFTSETFRNGVTQLFDQPAPSVGIDEILRFAVFSAISVLLFVLAPHFAAYFALHMRWGAVPWAFAMAYVAAAIVPMLVTVPIAIVFASSMHGFEQIAVAAYAIYLFCLCAACHFGILLRVEALANK